MLFAQGVQQFDWVALVEKGFTSLLFAIAFGYALWKIGNRLLDSHLELVKNANAKMDVATVALHDSNRLLEKIAARVDELPSDLPALDCKAEELADKIKNIVSDAGLRDCEAKLVLAAIEKKFKGHKEPS